MARAKDAHVTLLHIAGLPAGDYNVYISGQPVGQIRFRETEWIAMTRAQQEAERIYW